MIDSDRTDPAPRLRTDAARVELVPVGPEHYEFLRRLEFGHLGTWWRSRGTVSSPEEFSARIWAGVAVQCLGVGTEDGRPLVWLQCFNLDRENDVASLAIARLDGSVLSSRTAECVASFIDYCFEHLGIRKLYVEMAEPNALVVASAFGELLIEEARMIDHIRVGKSYHDLIIAGLWRENWNTSRFRSSLLGSSRATVS